MPNITLYSQNVLQNSFATDLGFVTTMHAHLVPDLGELWVTYKPQVLFLKQDIIKL